MCICIKCLCDWLDFAKFNNKCNNIKTLYYCLERVLHKGSISLFFFSFLSIILACKWRDIFNIGQSGFMPFSNILVVKWIYVTILIKNVVFFFVRLLKNCRLISCINFCQYFFKIFWYFTLKCIKKTDFFLLNRAIILLGHTIVIRPCQD